MPSQVKQPPEVLQGRNWAGLYFSTGRVAMATLGHSICPILGGQALSTGSNRNDSWFTLGHMSSWVLTLLELEQSEWGVGRGRVTSQQQHLTPEGGIRRRLSEGSAAAGSWRGGTLVAFSLLHAAMLQMRKCRLRDIDSLAQGHTAMVPPGHGPRLFPPYCFPGLTGLLAQKWSSVNIFLVKTPSRRLKL